MAVATPRIGRLGTGPGEQTGLKNMHQLVQLRWFAVGAQIVTIGLVHFGYRIPLPLDAMFEVLVCLAAFNVASLLHWRRHRVVRQRELFIALMVDVVSLTVLLYFSGGASNPFSFLFLLQVTLGAVLLESWTIWSLVAVATACFAGLTVTYRPLALPPAEGGGLPAAYTQGLLICFLLNAALLVVSITRVNRNLRARDARLAALRQRAAEEEHIVRMGLLASGAAHELGTPLATLAVILGDWRRMPEFAAQPELAAELGEMQEQVARCKRIVSGILLSAGETRGESSEKTTIGRFLDELVARWRATRKPSVFEFENRFGPDLSMVSDSTLAQMIDNVLDNALEASPAWLRLEATRDGEALVLTIDDAGPGFAAGMLDDFGTPYRSTKGRPGGGLGLFLVVNVARVLGGRVDASNPAERGARVVLTLPLAAIAFGPGDAAATAADDDGDEDADDDER